MGDTPPLGNHPQDQPPILDGGGPPHPTEQLAYNPPSMEVGHTPVPMRNSVTEGSCGHPTRNSTGSGTSAASGEIAKPGYMTDSRGDGDTRGQRWNQNDAKTTFLSLEGNTDPPNANFSASVSGGCHGAMQLPLQPNPHPQGESTAHIRTPQESGGTAAVEMRGLETNQTPKLDPVPDIEAVPVIKGTNEPTALSSFRRHMCETYSSDDDDVFLPNPPSKSQADKCIVAMDTEVGEERGVAGINLQAPRVVVTPDREEEGEEPMPPALHDDSATGMVQYIVHVRIYVCLCANVYSHPSIGGWYVRCFT